MTLGEGEGHVSKSAVKRRAARYMAGDVFRPGLKLSGDPPESKVLREALKYLRFHPKVAWAARFNSGKGFIAPSPTGVGRWIKFGFEGCSDILGQMKDGKLLAIECKSANGVLSVVQQQFLDVVSKNGGVSGVARCLDDVEKIVNYG